VTTPPPPPPAGGTPPSPPPPGGSIPPPPGGGYPAGPPAGGQPDTALAIVAHLSTWVAWFIGPLVIYLIAKDEFTKANARAALNFEISYTIWVVLSFILSLLLIGILFLLILVPLWLILPVAAAVKAGNGEVYTYPLAIPFVRG